MIASLRSVAAPARVGASSRTLLRIGFVSALVVLSSVVSAWGQGDRTPLHRVSGPPPVNIRAEKGLGKMVDGIVELWPQIAPPIAAELGLRAPRSVEIVVLSGGTFRPWANGLIPEWGVGFTNWPAGPIVLDADAVATGAKGLPEILRHELSHAYLGQRVGANASLPRWFVEGVAQAQSGEWRWLDTYALVRGAVSNELPALERIEVAFPRGGLAARQAYALSLSAVLSLEDRLRDQGGWRALVDAVAGGERFDEAFLRLTGSTVHAFALSFDESLDSRYGWIAAVSQVASLFGLMTLLFLAGYARTVYRNRRRLSEMDAEDDSEQERDSP